MVLAVVFLEPCRWRLRGGPGAAGAGQAASRQCCRAIERDALLSRSEQRSLKFALAAQTRACSAVAVVAVGLAVERRFL